MSKKKLLMIGAGLFAQLCYEYFTSDSDYEVVGFSVDGEYINEPSMNGLPVVPWEEAERLFNPTSHQAFVAASYTGLNRLRSRFYNQALSKGYELASYVSSRALVNPKTVVGDNAFILEGCTVQPYSRLGSNVGLGVGSCVNHHSVLGDHNFLSAHVVVLGKVNIGDHCFLGANCTIFDHCTIGSRCIIGAGSVVNCDLPDDSLVKVGPCQVLPLDPERTRSFG